MSKFEEVFRFLQEEDLEQEHSLRSLIGRNIRILPALQNKLYSHFHLLTFASNDFKKRQEVFDIYVKKKIFKTHTKTDERTAEDSKLFQDNPSFSPQQRGYGFWLWKPLLIRKTLKTIPKNDILCYIDSGDKLRRDPVPLLNKLHKQHDIVLNSKEKFKTIQWTKRDALIKMNKDTQIFHQSFQIEAGFLSVKKTEWSEKFIEEWGRKCQDFQLVSDNPSELGPEYPNFQEHRHDQAILNLLSFHPKICRSKKIDNYIIQNA